MAIVVAMRGLALVLLLLGCTQVLAYTLSVPSLQVAVGQTFPLTWTSTSSDLENADICLNDINAIQFLRIGSIQRMNQLEGTVEVTVNKTIAPGTYTLGIRFPGCAFLLAQDFNDFVVTAPASPSPSPPQSHRSSSSSSPPPPPPPPAHTSSKALDTSPTPTTSSSTSRATSAGGTHTGPDSDSDSGQTGSGINTGSVLSTTSSQATSTTTQSQANSTTSTTTPTSPGSSDTPTPSSGALSITGSNGFWGKGTAIQFAGYLFGALVVFL